MQPFSPLYRRFHILFVTLLLAGCAFSPRASTTPSSAVAAQPVAVRGTFNYSNDLFLQYHRRHAVALVDLHGFVIRDQRWNVPAESLIFGRLTLDEAKQSASYQVDLPLQPLATANRIGNSEGVKLYAAAYWADPFSENDSLSGWPTYLSSLRTDTEQADEVTGGKLLAWAPDDTQQFPSDFGSDHMLFSGDDPLQPLPAGYSVIDLDKRPFSIERAATPELNLIEAKDISKKDFSKLSYRHAFEQLFIQTRLEYAFNGIVGKEPDWDALFAKVAPQVLAAEQAHDAKAFFVALRNFVQGLRDGHSSIDGGDLEQQVRDATFGGGYGLAIRMLDDGRALVVYAKKGGPAERAGIQVGAELHTFNGATIDAALNQVMPPTAPFSTERARRYDQARYLLRAPVGTSAALTFTNPEGREQRVTLQAIDEKGSLQATSLHRGIDPTAPPIEYWILDSGLGYMRINSNDDDNELINELFKRALDSFHYNDVPGIIIDMRQNDGGTNLDLAGYLTKEPIPLSQLEYFNTATGKFEPDGGIEQIEPVSDPYSFKKLALLVGPACYSACEIEAYGFSKLKNMVVVGSEPTAGVEAEVARGEFTLPEGITIQIPTGRYVNKDGSLFLEGAGVAPTLRVPFDAPAALADNDIVLAAAEQAVLK